MAPQIVSKKGREIVPPEPAASADAASTEVATPGSTPLLMAQERELRAKLKELRDHIVKNADNVGERFPNEARKTIPSLQHGRRFGIADPKAGPEHLHLVRGSA